MQKILIPDEETWKRLLEENTGSNGGLITYFGVSYYEFKYPDSFPALMVLFTEDSNGRWNVNDFVYPEDFGPSGPSLTWEELKLLNRVLGYAQEAGWQPHPVYEKEHNVWVSLCSKINHFTNKHRMNK